MQHGRIAPTHEVVGVSFHPLTAEEIARLSVTEIFHHETNDRALKDRAGTLNDPSTGCGTEPTAVCHTCGESASVCPGHYGHVPLAAPVFNPVFLTHMLKLLRCICWACSAPRFVRSHDAVARLRAIRVPQNRMKIALGMCRTARVCPHCDEPLPRFMMKKRDGLKLSRVGGGAGAQDGFVQAGEVLEVFRAVSQADCELLGVERPEKMIMSALLVPPPCLRPQMEKDNGARAEEALTFKLSDIIKANAAVARDPCEKTHAALQYYIAAFMDSEAPCPKNVNVTMRRSTPGVLDRVAGKEGDVRGHIMGSRSDFSARSVAESDPSLAVNEVGVPQRILFTQFFTEVATPISIEWLQTMVDRGPDHPLGARHIHKHPTFFEVDLKTCPPSSPLRRVRLGDRVERYYRDGDYAHVNRQPTLHGPSIQGLRVRAHNSLVFKVNTAVCTAFNLDFDGDEINLHFPQCHEAVAEVRDMLGTQRQMVSTTNSSPIIMPIQDTVLGFHLLLANDSINDTAAASMLMAAEADFIEQLDVRYACGWEGMTSPRVPHGLAELCVPDSIRWESRDVLAFSIKSFNDSGAARVAVMRAFPNAERLWRGKDLLRAVLPVGLQGKFGSLSIDGQGQVSGDGDKGALNGSGGLLHRISSVHGAQRGMRFIWQVQRLAATYLTHHAFSIGPQSIDVPRSIQADVDHIIGMASEDVQDLLTDCHAGKMPKLPGHSIASSFEALSMRILNKCINAVTNVAREKVPDDNALRTVVKAKSRASEVNLVQSCAALFQQNIRGGRAPMGWEGRSMTAFPKFSNEPRARGMVAHSFAAGLDGPEFVMASMGGRVGLVDTAVYTGYTGYAQRRLTKGMENVSVRADLTVRNEHGSVIMFNYGGNSFHPAQESKQPLWCATDPLPKAAQRTCDPTLFEQHACQPPPDQWHYPLGCFKTPQCEVRALAEARAWFTRSLTALHPFLVSAVNLPWLLSSGTLEAGECPFELHAQLRDEFVQRCRQYVPGLNLPGQTTDSPENAGATTFELLLLQNSLHSSVCHVCPRSLWGEAWRLFRQALVAPGSTVGLWSAFALGEPSTQLTLNTFHASGLATGQNYGISRFNEIINCNKTIACPTTFVHLEEGASVDEVASRIRFVKMRCVVHTSQCVGVPNDDAEWVGVWCLVNGEDPSIASLGADPQAELGQRLMLRITLSRESLQQHFGGCVSRVQDLLRGVLPCSMGVESHPESPDQCVVLAWLQEGARFEDLVKAEQEALKLRVGGVQGMGSVLPEKQPKPRMCVEKGLVNDEETVLIAEGTNILEVMALPGVDATRTFTNDIKTIASVLGIEAARAAIEREVSEVLSQNNIFVNPKHVALVPAMICHSGTLVPMSRFGINRGANTTLLKASFEESSEMFSEAAFHGIHNGILGIADANFFGKRVPVGTGATEVQVNPDAIVDLCVPEQDDLAFWEQECSSPTRELLPVEPAQGSAVPQDVLQYLAMNA